MLPCKLKMALERRNWSLLKINFLRAMVYFEPRSKNSCKKVGKVTSERRALSLWIVFNETCINENMCSVYTGRPKKMGLAIVNL